MIDLIVVAHPDDEVLGFGAAGSRYVSEGHKVYPFIMCSGVSQRNKRPSDNELLQDIISANQELGFQEPILQNFANLETNTIPHVELVKAIENVIVKVNPHRIFTHHPSDINIDHSVISHCCLVAARLPQRSSKKLNLESVYYMEIPSASDWSYPSLNSSTFEPNLFVEVDHFIEKKLASLALYRDVMRDYPHPRSELSLNALATYRGSQAGLSKAEAFQLAFSKSSLR